MGEWISVEERLPQKKGEYLVAYHPCYWDRVYPEMRTGIDTFRGNLHGQRRNKVSYKHQTLPTICSV